MTISYKICDVGFSLHLSVALGLKYRCRGVSGLPGVCYSISF